MNERVTKIYEEICALTVADKVILYNKIADDFEKADPSLAESAATPQIHVPKWLYRILARWSHA